MCYHIKNSKQPKRRTANTIRSLEVRVRLPAEGDFEKLLRGIGILDLKKSVGLDRGRWLEEERSRREQWECSIVHRIDVVEHVMSWCFCSNA